MVLFWACSNYLKFGKTGTYTHHHYFSDLWKAYISQVLGGVWSKLKKLKSSSTASI